MEEEISSTGLNTLGREEVRMFSGAGMVSVYTEMYINISFYDIFLLQYLEQRSRCLVCLLLLLVGLSGPDAGGERAGHRDEAGARAVLIHFERVGRPKEKMK